MTKANEAQIKELQRRVKELEEQAILDCEAHYEEGFNAGYEVGIQEGFDAGIQYADREMELALYNPKGVAN